MTQVLIGDIYLRQQCDVFWLGYTISPAYARQGYAIEAITATIDCKRKLTAVCSHQTRIGNLDAHLI